MTASSSLGIDALPLLPAAAAAVPDPLESRLIRRAQAGDTAAFRSLVEAHQDFIHRLCVTWLQCEDDAREATQDTFLRAWQALPAWEHRSKFTTWLYQIALNLCRDRAKSKATRQRRATVPLAGLPIAPACPHASPDLAAARSGDLEKLQRGLAALPEAARTLLVLCAIEGFSYQEAAALLHCTERAVEGRLYRARQMLWQWWENPASR